ncbi:MAG: WhiB family transcriptional regulator, redox-sensing transcriptional regulator, partial [Acidimicrobiaceae bacterium]|nr:WhiB family transcriptional regulator, redox-sensing transcriptional regulator [Acidimicrobiaceae bacterium]
MEPSQVTASALAQARWSQQDWTAHAVCVGMTELFFPPAGEREPARLVREAKARVVCASCPVAVECRAFARQNHEYGFWGGENEEERFIALRRDRRVAG